MTLPTGMRMGPYEIVELLGAGGMGEVYRSRDTRLGRTVALKVLSPMLAGDAGWRQRFEREARIVAGLSHPHICPVFDVGAQDEAEFLVMEYLDGQTLQDRLASGALPVDRAIRYAIEIADALAAAHREGVCHRDLKPGNIMLTKSGARLLDFGLARSAMHVGSVDQQTISSGLTEKGIVLGTLQYMAPEQLEGRDTDARTDIFAFGSLVYEMLTGKRAFPGQSPAAVIAAILEHHPPPISSAQPAVTPALDRAIRKCLAKDPDERWQDVRDLRDELKWTAQTPLTDAAASFTRGRTQGALIPWSFAAILAAALIALAVVHFRERTPEIPRVAFTFPRPTTVFSIVDAPTVSPDGSRIVFSGPSTDGRRVLWLRSIDALRPEPLVGTDNDGGPLTFWSPDGQSLAFFTDRKLKRLDLAGGPPQTIADAPDVWGGSWSSTGVILFTPTAKTLSQVPATGGAPTPVLEVDPSRGELGFLWPHFLPDGRHFLYGVAGTSRKNDVYLSSLDHEPPRLILRGTEGAMFVRPGYLLFVRDGSLFAQPFNPDSLQTTGDAFPVRGQEQQAIHTAWGLVSASETGVLSYVVDRARNTQLRWYDRSGHPLGEIGPPAPTVSVVASPDETRLAVSSSNGTASVVPLTNGIATQVTSPGGFASDPIWSADSQQLLFTVFEGVGNVGNVYRRAILGGHEEPVFRSPESKYALHWAKDGTSVVFMTGDAQVYQLKLTPEAKPRLLFSGSAAIDGLRLSPNERWIAYNSTESGRWEIYVASFPSFAGKRQVSNAGGCQPVWREDGKELFYLDLRGILMSVDVSAGESFDAAAPAPLFQTPVIVDPIRDQYAAIANGTKFILVTPAGDEEPITVLINWISGLKK